MVTKEQLLENGWKETDNSLFIFEKEIENRNHLNGDPDDTGIRMVIHRMFNVNTPALMLPDGGLLNLKAESIEDLNKFESLINFYDCPY